MGIYKFHSLVWFLTFISHLMNRTKAHFLTVEDLEEFYDLEEKLVKTFTNYIEEQKQILEVIEVRYEEQKSRQPDVNDPEEYLRNPLNVLAMLKRMVYHWPLTLTLLGDSLADEEEEESIRLPTIDEYYAAVHGIARLQQVYQYSTESIISGTAFQDTDNTSLFSADDCLAVGKDFYDNRYYFEATDWFNQVLRVVANQREDGKDVVTNASRQETSFPLEDTYELLALSSCFMGDQKQSKKYFKKLYNEYPEFRPTQNLIKDHLLALNQACEKLVNDESLKPVAHKLELSWQEDAELSTNYSQLCQATTWPSSPHLRCRLVHQAGPYWRMLQPFKQEELHHNPDVYITYDVISPAERLYFIENMIEEDNLYVSGFVYEFWRSLPENSSLSESLVRRTEAVTRATVHNTREQTCLATFPPGAEYVVETDLSNKTKEPEKVRLGSTVYHLEQPLAGGLVVFPRLGFSVAPEAGAALTTFNINQEKKVDGRTAIGVCPVIRGHRTTLTLWLKRPD